MVTGVDTNILLRLLLADEERQFASVKAFLAARAPSDIVFVNHMVLVELVWTLKVRYGYGMDRILDALAKIGERPDIVFEDPDLVREAIASTARGCDFADALIALRNRKAGCGRTVTFDRKAAKSVPGMKLLA